MELEEIKKILEKYEIEAEDKSHIFGFINELAQKNEQESEKSKQTQGNEPDVEKQNLPAQNLTQKIQELEKRFEDFSLNKNQYNNPELEDKINELKQQVPEKFQKIIPSVSADLQLMWLENAIKSGVFDQGTDEIGSEITPTLTGRNHEPVRPMTRQEIEKLSDEEYDKLVSSGHIDFLIRNNLITE